jgi:hypothetical protein
LTSTLALTACDLEEPSPNDDTADLLLEAETEGEVELALAKTTPSIDELLEGSEAAALQTWLERQGYSMVSSEVELGQNRESYYWGIKFNTCDPCGGVNPNGCCGCLPGHPC